MVSISINSGQFQFGKQQPSASSKKTLKVLVLGDFSARESRDHNEWQKIQARKSYRIDKDNFDDVFRALNVRLQLPFAEQPIEFASIDDLHPDHLYNNIQLFERFKKLFRMLKKPDQFHQAVDALIDEGIIESFESSNGSVTSGTVDSGFLLDSLLSAPSVVASESQIQTLIRQTIAPYVEEKENPHIEKLSAAIDCAVTDVMRQTMHSSLFQQLEAVWRGVDLLNRRMDTDQVCHLNIMDITVDEILSDIDYANGDVKNTQLYKNIIEENAVAGGQAFDVIVFDPLLGSDKAVRALSGISELSESAGVIVLAGVSLASSIELSNELSFSDAMSQLRSQSFSQKIFIATPSFMLRLPYGAKTSVIEEFPYEELPESNSHDFYLWGNSAYLMMLCIVDSKSVPAQFGGAVERLPLHTYSADGEMNVKPCAEKYCTSSEVSQLESQGFTVVQSVKNADKILISTMQAFSG